MKRLAPLLLALFLTAPALAQVGPSPGPGPQPDVWQNNGADIYRQSGKVGIGTPTPTTTFQVSGGKATLAPSTTGYAPLSLGQGVAPTSPSNGDCWQTSTGLFCRVNGVTVGPLISATQNNTFGPSQRSTPVAITIATATFTPNFDTGQNYTIGLTSACPCTLANPSTTPVAGQQGVIQITQDGTGSRTIGTWGSQYIYEGGTSTIALSTAANAKDFFGYWVIDSTHILLMTGALNATH